MFLPMISMFGVFVGFFFLNDATMGVGIIGASCAVGIFARVVQADDQYRELKKLLLDKAREEGAR